MTGALALPFTSARFHWLLKAFPFYLVYRMLHLMYGVYLLLLAFSVSASLHVQMRSVRVYDLLEHINFHYGDLTWKWSLVNWWEFACDTRSLVDNVSIICHAAEGAMRRRENETKEQREQTSEEMDATSFHLSAICPCWGLSKKLHTHTDVKAVSSPFSNVYFLLSQQVA